MNTEHTEHCQSAQEGYDRAVRTELSVIAYRKRSARVLASAKRKCPLPHAATAGQGRAHRIEPGLYWLDTATGRVWIESDENETPEHRWVVRDTEHLTDHHSEIRGPLRQYRTLADAVAEELYSATQ